MRPPAVHAYVQADTGRVQALNGRVALVVNVLMLVESVDPAEVLTASGTLAAMTSSLRMWLAVSAVSAQREVPRLSGWLFVAGEA